MFRRSISIAELQYLKNLRGPFMNPLADRAHRFEERQKELRQKEIRDNLNVGLAIFLSILFVAVLTFPYATSMVFVQLVGLVAVTFIGRARGHFWETQKLLARQERTSDDLLNLLEGVLMAELRALPAENHELHPTPVVHLASDPSPGVGVRCNFWNGKYTLPRGMRI